MERYITDLASLASKDLNNYDWDIIELNINANNTSMNDWYYEIKNNFSHSSFSVDKTHLMKPELRDKLTQFVEQNLWGIPKQWTLQWAVERDDPIPFRYVADPEQYPEILSEDFEKKFNTFLNQYYFGEYKNLVETLGEEVWEVSRLVQLDTDTGLKPHVDTPPPGFLPRMHYQIQYTTDSWWEFYDGQDGPLLGRYYLEQGKFYIMNTAVHHAAKNEGSTPWVMLHSNPTPSAIDKLLEISRNA